MSTETESALLSAKEVARRLDNKIHVATVLRWMREGYSHPPIFLQSVRLGGTNFTTVEWTQSFLDRCAARQRERQEEKLRRQAERQNSK